jgi:nitroreductase
MEAIYKRRSIRKYSAKDVSDDEIDQILTAGMAAPSAGNQQPWEFIVVKDRSKMEAITKIHPYAQMLTGAKAAIIVCADLKREKHKGYWVQDCSAATQNILLEATSLGVGTVWLGVYPRDDRVEGIKRLFGLPEDVMPLNVISLGYPAEEKGCIDRYDKDRIHLEKW